MGHFYSHFCQDAFAGGIKGMCLTEVLKQIEKNTTL